MRPTIDGICKGGVVKSHAPAPAVVVVLHRSCLLVARAKSLALFDGVEIAEIDLNPVAIVVACLWVAN